MRRLTAALVCLLAFSALVAPPAHAHTMHTIEPGSGPILDDEWTFCHPGQDLNLSVHTAVGNAFAIWNFIYNPALGFFVEFGGIVIAKTDPMVVTDYAGYMIPTPPGSRDEIVLVYVYGQPHWNYLYNGPAPLIGPPPETHCSGGGYHA